MPTRPPTLCAGGCGALVSKGHCPTCKPRVDQRKDEQRGTASQRGYDSKWKKARDQYLRAHPLCVIDLAQGRTEASTIVDHIKPHRGDQKLFWDRKNWQALCKHHHDQKTAAEVHGRRRTGGGGGYFPGI